MLVKLVKMGKFWRSFRFCLTVWFRQFHFDSRREYVDHWVKHSSASLDTVGGNGNVQLKWDDDNWLAIKWMDSLLVRISGHWLNLVKWEFPRNSRRRKVQVSTENNLEQNKWKPHQHARRTSWDCVGVLFICRFWTMFEVLSGVMQLLLEGGAVVTKSTRKFDTLTPWRALEC